MISRLIYLAVLLASALLLGLGMYFQYALHLHSCSPQVLIRYALVFTALLALFVVAINAGKIVRIVMSVGIGLVSLVGAAVAAHQSWPRHVPQIFSSVGVNLDSVIRALPLGDVLPKFFLGVGSCDGARWTMIGVAGSEWALLAFLLFIVAAFLAAHRG
jgi:protein dithiol:quinone oxidoreductase